MIINESRIETAQKRGKTIDLKFYPHSINIYFASRMGSDLGSTFYFLFEQKKSVYLCPHNAHCWSRVVHP